MVDCLSVDGGAATDRGTENMADAEVAPGTAMIAANPRRAAVCIWITGRDGTVRLKRCELLLPAIRINRGGVARLITRVHAWERPGWRAAR